MRPGVIIEHRQTKYQRTTYVDILDVQKAGVHHLSINRILLVASRAQSSPFFSGSGSGKN